MHHFLFLFFLYVVFGANFDSKSFRETLRSRLRVLPAAFTFHVAASRATEGAFEMDIQYYLKSLLNPNASIGEIKQRGVFPSARKLDQIFASSLVEIIKDDIARYSGSSISDISNYVTANLARQINYIQTFAPITELNFSDQYYFDTVVYLCYRFAEKTIPSSENRVALRNSIGLKTLKLLNVKLPEVPSKVMPTDTLSIGIRRILLAFKERGIIESFLIDDENLIDTEYAVATLTQGFKVPIQFTLIKPANMIGWLEFAGPILSFFIYPT